MSEAASPLEELRPGDTILTGELFTQAEVTSRDRVLDVGCGRGESVAFIGERYGCPAIGVDRSEEAISQARARFPQATYLVAEAEHLPFDDSSFDIVVAECVVSLFEEPEVVLDEIGRVLRPDGRFLMSDLYDRAIDASGCAIQRTSYHEVGGSGTAKASGPIIGNVYPASRFHMLLESHGFHTIFEEDRSDCLQRIVGQMIFDEGLDRVEGVIGIARADLARIGYLAIVAESSGRL